MQSTTSTARRFVSLWLVSLWTAGCNPSSIGRPCINPNGDKPEGTQISSPALECASRLCLITVPQGANASGVIDGGANCQGGRCVCTAECGSNGDCQAETTADCKSGFVCAIAAEAGPFCCRKLCMCADDLVTGFNRVSDGSNKVMTPFACDPKSGAVITCPNVKH